MINLPACTGYKDYFDEFDCDAVHGEPCEDCLCCYNTLGGKWGPETGMFYPEEILISVYGEPNYYAKES